MKVAELVSLEQDMNIKLLERAQNLLYEDDKVMIGLQKLINELAVEDPTQDIAAKRVQELGARLIKHMVERVRTILDSTYLEDSTGVDDYNEIGSANVEALKEEVESLYTEILPVAQIAVGQQFLEPVARAQGSYTAKNKATSGIAAKYVRRRFPPPIIDTC